MTFEPQCYNTDAGDKRNVLQLEKLMDRREFIRTAFQAGTLASAGMACPGLFSARDSNSPVSLESAPGELWKWSKEAYDYSVVGKDMVICRLCPNRCRIPAEKRSLCGVRVNKGGKLYSLVYGNPASVHVDPVEKKPLYHFYPSSMVYSMGTAGCNFDCLNCQNWELSQKKPEELRNQSVSPEQAVLYAKKRKCRSIAYTYNEPTVAYEFMFDTAAAAQKNDVKNIYVSNGYINPKPLERLARFIDGANIDLKSFNRQTYRKLNRGRLKPVLETLQMLNEKNVWLEIVYLIVPQYTDRLNEIKEMCKWIKKELGPDVPLHFSRFFPQYKLRKLSPTPPSLLFDARKIARKQGLHYVYIGNLRTRDGSDTLCPGCGKAVIKRTGYFITQYHIKENACAFCKTPIAGRWSAEKKKQNPGTAEKKK